MNDTPVPDGISDAFMTANLGVVQYAIVMCIRRQTSRALSESFLSRETGVSKRGIQRALKILIKKNIITVVKEATFTSPREMAIQSDHTLWRVKHPVADEQYSAPGDESCASPGDTFITSPDDEPVTTPGDKSVTQRKKTKKNIKTYLCGFIKPFDRTELFTKHRLFFHIEFMDSS